MSRTHTEQSARSMHVRCPHCQNPIEFVDDDESFEFDCPSCGSSFNLASDVETIGPDGSSSRSSDKGGGTTHTLSHFELIEKVGVGTFGAVYRARDIELDRLVAVKIPRQSQLDGPQAEQFLREARAAAQLKHPNIVSVHEVGREDDTLYIVSDFVEGLSLADWLSGQQLTAREAAELCVTIAGALEHAHEQGVTHRDLKPSNIMVTRIDGVPRAKIIDFGLARVAGHDHGVKNPHKSLAGIGVDANDVAKGAVAGVVVHGDVGFKAARLRSGGVSNCSHFAMLRRGNPVRRPISLQVSP